MALQIQQLVELQPFNTLGVPAIAEYYCQVTTVGEIQDALAFARSKGLAFSILGGGSNQVCAPEVAGLVCHIKLRGISHKTSSSEVSIQVAAGENWHNFVRYTLGQGWAGLETLSLIPGQVGAAPIQNIGAYGTELSDFVREVQVLDRSSLEQRRLSVDQCQFGYRDSYLKRSSNYVVTAVSFGLQPQQSSGISSRDTYPDVARELEALGWHTPSPRQVAEAVIRVRRRKLPDPEHHGNVGSVFHNPVVDTNQLRSLEQKIPNLVRYPGPAEGQHKLAAAQLIDAAGWKGRSMHGFVVWSRQPLVIVRAAQGQGDGRGMHKLTAAIAADIAERYGVALTLEPQLLGFT